MKARTTNVGILIGVLLVLFFGVIQGSEAAGKSCSPNKHPVVLIPGIGGSVLEALLDIPVTKELPHWTCTRKSSSYKRLWLSLTDIAPVQLDCFLSYFNLDWSNFSQSDEGFTPSQAEGVDIRVPKFGSTYAIDYLDPNFITSYFSQYFHPLIKSLIDVGYTDEKDLFAAPFDWRFWPDDKWIEETKLLIEKAVFMNNGIPAILVSHSMGGPFGYVFLMHQTESWKSKFIYNWVVASAPWTGTPLSLIAMLTGYSFDLPVSQSKAATAARSLPSVYFLLPNSDFGDWSKRVVVITPEQNYTASDISNILTSKAGVKWAKSAVDKVHSFFDYTNYKHPNVNVTLFISKGVKTLSGLRYKTSSDLLKSQNLPDIEYNNNNNKQQSPTDNTNPENLSSDGDGTVMLESLQFACSQWNEPCVIIDGCHHWSTIKHETVINAVISLACKN